MRGHVLSCNKPFDRGCVCGIKTVGRAGELFE